MSTCVLLAQSALPSPSPRKRTTSFSLGPSESHRPAKIPRMGATSSPLRRSESVLLLPTPPVDAVPYSRTLSFYKEQRQRRKTSKRSSEQLTIKTTPLSKVEASSPKPRVVERRATKPPTAPSKVIMPSASSPVTIYLTPRRSSPLAPHPPAALPGRPVFPRSKPCQDLYKTAIKMRMLTTEEGKKILSLGPRLAMEIMQTSKDILRVTKELEMMVGDEDADGDCVDDDDVVMDDATTSTPTNSPTSSPVASKAPSSSMPPTPRPSSSPLPPLQPLLPTYSPPAASQIQSAPAPPVLTTSWVVVKGSEDWEMIDCAA